MRDPIGLLFTGSGFVFYGGLIGGDAGHDAVLPAPRHPVAGGVRMPSRRRWCSARRSDGSAASSPATATGARSRRCPGAWPIRTRSSGGRIPRRHGPSDPGLRDRSPTSRSSRSSGAGGARPSPTARSSAGIWCWRPVPASWSSSCASIRWWRAASRPPSSRASSWSRIGGREAAGAATMADRRGLKIVARHRAAIGLAAVLGLLRRSSAATPSLAPDFAVPDLAGPGGAPVRPAGARWCSLNLWTTWCPPCREEMPSMERLYQRLRDRGFVAARRQPGRGRERRPWSRSCATSG